MIHFHHIRKCGGTSITHSLINFFDSDKILEVKGFNYLFKKKPSLINYKKFLNSELLNLQNYSFIHGHENILDYNDPDLKRFTFVRKPDAQRFSQFKQIKQIQDHNLDWLKKNNYTREYEYHSLAKNLSFNEILKYNHPLTFELFFNPIAMSFISLSDIYRIKNYDPTDTIPNLKKLPTKYEISKILTPDEIFNIFLKKIDLFFMIGVVENFKQDFRILRDILGIPNSKNIPKYNQRIISSKEQTFAKEDSFSEIDYEIYNYIIKNINNNHRSILFDTKNKIKPPLLNFIRKNKILYSTKKSIFGSGMDPKTIDNNIYFCEIYPKIFFRVSEDSKYRIKIKIHNYWTILNLPLYIFFNKSILRLFFFFIHKSNNNDNSIDCGSYKSHEGLLVIKLKNFVRKEIDYITHKSKQSISFKSIEIIKED